MWWYITPPWTSWFSFQPDHNHNHNHNHIGNAITVCPLPTTDDTDRSEVAALLVLDLSGTSSLDAE
jgi:hypothetical protein